jgi:hypothetical protein
MRAILIDPEKQTLTEIQITDSDDEHLAILQCEDLHRGAVLSRDETGYDAIIVNNDSLSLDEPGFTVDGDGHPFVRRAIAMRYTPFGDHRQDIIDLQISLAELTKRITFVPATQERE